MHRRALLSTLPLTLLLAGCAATERAEGAAEKSGSAAGSASGPAGPVMVKDVLGREVTFEQAPERVFLSEARLAYSLLFLQKDDAAAKVVAWPDDFAKAAPDMWRRLQDASPSAAGVTTVGSLQRGDLTLENLLALRPDAAVISMDAYEAAKATPFFDGLERAGVPYVVVDFRRKPLENTRTSVRALGGVFGRSEEAERFLTYYDGVVAPIVAADEKRTDGRPTVFHWRSPGISEPGRTYGDSNFGQITSVTGGENLGSRFLSGDEGTLSTEQLLESQPRLVIASGGEWGHQKIDGKSHTGYVHLGYDATPEQARASLAALAEEPGYDQLDAFREGRVFGVYHQFYNAPFNFIVYQAFARWQGLEGFTDVDVDTTWRQFHDEFMPFAAEGTVAVGLEGAAR